MTIHSLPFNPVDMKLQDILFTQGFGTRRICAGLIQKGFVSVQKALPTSPQEGFTCILDPNCELPIEGLQFKVTGVSGLPEVTWTYARYAYVALHKPAGYECSHKPSAWPSVYNLLPFPLRQRPQKSTIQGVQAIGRLDQDTTGLLIFTDDGKFIHHLSSPKYHAPKVYEITTKHPVDAQQIKQLMDGVVLDDSPKPVKAAACEAISTPGETMQMKLTLTEGKYHQVKRMIAAVGNRVERLHRSQMGAFKLPPDLEAGQWRWLTKTEVEKLQQHGDIGGN